MQSLSSTVRIAASSPYTKHTYFIESRPRRSLLKVIAVDREETASKSRSTSHSGNTTIHSRTAGVRRSQRHGFDDAHGGGRRQPRASSGSQPARAAFGTATLSAPRRLALSALPCRATCQVWRIALWQHHLHEQQAAIG